MKGQINRGSILGELIYELCKKDNIKTIVEIGTWNGLGTTKCIYDAIIDSDKKDYEVYSLESNEFFHNQAINNIPKIINFNIILGKIVETDELYNLSKYEMLNISDTSQQKIWLEDDINNYKNVKNVINILPKKIDLLILDGGEFSSFAEFNKLKDRTTYFVLDDTNILKNFEVANIMRNDKTYDIIIDSDDRNGFILSKKINL
jgi:hypothetical protein